MYNDTSVGGISGSAGVDMSKPSLRSAIALLRDRAKWPQNFEWNYGNACRCAMGLFRDTWNAGGVVTAGETSRLIGVGKDDGDYIFLRLHVNREACDITPDVVADKLAALCA